MVPVYMSLIKLTDQGIENIRCSELWIKASCHTVEQMGGKVIGQYSLSGEYDYVAICKFPSHDAATSFFVTLDSLGYVQSTFSPVFVQEGH